MTEFLYTDTDDNIDSSVFSDVYYDGETETLALRFHSGLAVAYGNVSPEAWYGIDSYGEFYNSELKHGHYNHPSEGLVHDATFRFRTYGDATPTTEAADALESPLRGFRVVYRVENNESPFEFQAPVDTALEALEQFASGARALGLPVESVIIGRY